MGSTALAGSLIKNDGSGGGDVQRAHATGHGDAKQMVAGAADEIVKSCALATEDDDEVAGEIELIVVGCAPFIETDDPEIVALEIFKSADKVDDTGDAKMLGGACAGLDGGGAEGSGTALGEDDAIDTGAIGNAEKSAEILRVFNAVEGEDEASCRVAGYGLEEIFDGERFLRTDERDDSLMSSVVGGGRELLARFTAYGDSGLAELRDEAFKPVVAALPCDEDLVKAAAARFESFLNRVQAVENFHEISLVRAQLSTKNGDLEAPCCCDHCRVLGCQSHIAARGERDIGSVVCREPLPLPYADQRANLIGETIRFDERQEGGDVAEKLSSFSLQNFPSLSHKQSVGDFQMPMNGDHWPRSADHQPLDAHGIGG